MRRWCGVGDGGNEEKKKQFAVNISLKCGLSHFFPSKSLTLDEREGISCAKSRRSIFWATLQEEE